ncbi:MAG TPA: chorismate synthase [Bacillota bacterium]|nr:chorismate synthase [Peptococcaceae bacterium MAG4]NLW37793.1 chorismate synthase [Peptococcaceae bacterium]HPZ44288.1 chorismate synthase [Bacillota bacterium]HQD76884.1 chorismate synthase [Bacillota bacterium]HUM59539.1 chorismate synthase [Bacillota bacterium]
MLRYLTAGESHGPALIAIVEGMPSGLPLTAAYINRQLARRQGGYGRGARMKIESDTVSFLSGVRDGLTLGSPITLLVENKDWANWSEIMSAEPGARTGERVVRCPRPGHADLAGALKYRHQDLRNVLERSSARETAARVAAGSVARRLLEELGITIIGQVVQLGGLSAAVENLGSEELQARLEQSKLNCADPAVEPRMLEAIDAARAAGDTLGGVFEVRAYGVPAGLGSYTHWDRKLDARLAAALMSIQAVKGVEVGLGFTAAGLRGSQVQDEIFYEAGRGFYRLHNRAGGIEGGVTNGETLVVRGAMKPIPTLNQPLQSVDMITRKPSRAAVERSDVCAVPAACVIGEALVAWELARACLEKCGGDSLEELKDNWNRHLSYLRKV